MKCKLTRIAHSNPFKSSNYKKSIHSNYACELSYSDIRCSTQLKELLMSMTQKYPQNRITAINARTHRFMQNESYKPANTSEYFRKYRDLVTS